MILGILIKVIQLVVIIAVAVCLVALIVHLQVIFVEHVILQHIEHSIHKHNYVIVWMDIIKMVLMLVLNAMLAVLLVTQLPTVLHVILLLQVDFLQLLHRDNVIVQMEPMPIKQLKNVIHVHLYVVHVILLLIV